jgi:hypothetical protein
VRVGVRVWVVVGVRVRVGVRREVGVRVGVVVGVGVRVRRPPLYAFTLVLDQIHHGLLRVRARASGRATAGARVMVRARVARVRP